MVIATASLMRVGRALSIGLVALLSSAGCGEPEEGSPTETEWEPAQKPAPPAVGPDRPSERSACAPHRVTLKDGFVMEVPVECVEHWLDRGDPPPSEVDDRFDAAQPANELEQLTWEA